MRQAQAQVEDLRLEIERRHTYQGTARIGLEVLHFRQDQHRRLDRKNVEFLKGCFRKYGCRPLEVGNCIRARIDRESLDDALRESGLTARDLLSNQTEGYPELVFPSGQQLECLNGQHRIQAAREFLSPKDKWWAVELYLADANRELKTCLIEEYSNEEKPSDGEIYCKIRHYHFQRNHSLEMRWWARLRGNRAKNLNTLLRHSDLTNAFDALLDIRGLWDGMMITTLHKMMAMKCDEEIMHYLEYIKEVWSGLLQGDKAALRKVDQATVKALELRAPQTSTLDAASLRSQILGGQVFSAFSDHERQDIWERVQLVEGVIPSLFTFFKDILYLHECAACMRRLLSLTPQETLFSTLERRFTGVNQRDGFVIEQVTEDSFIYKPGCLADQVDLGVRQLVAYAMHHLYNMPQESKKDDRVMKSTVNVDKTVLRRFADLAERLGFESPEITNLKQYPNSTTVRDPEQSGPLLVTPGPGLARDHRCGPPRARDFEEDHRSIFIRYLHDGQEVRGEGVTSFFVLRSRYFAFFGKLRIANRGTSTGLPAFSPESGQSSQPEDEIRGSTNEPGHNISQDLGRNRDHVTDMEVDVESEEQRLERLEWERLERERRERLERLERERLEQERLERERLERERLEQERLEQERLEREVLEQKRLEKERLEQERLGQLERERLKREGLEQQRLEQERLERERLEREMLERKRLERRRLERERLEQQRLEQERLERERLGRLEREILEQQRLEKERLEQQRLEQERLEQERLERERLEREVLERKRLEQQILEEDRLEQERLERERLEQESNEEHSTDTEQVPPPKNQEREEPAKETKVHTQDPQPALQPSKSVATNSAAASSSRPTNTVRIDFKVRERGIWKDIPPLIVNLSDPSEVEYIAIKNLRKGIRTFDTNLRMLAPNECFEAVTGNGTNTMLLIPQEELVIDDEMLNSAAEIHAKAVSQGLKRVAIDDISRFHHSRKRLAVD
ncbi:MAG: hypothetical protein M1840_003841 [Geoglossum simile]|nr:MAG: hypothetical protein M1840_003841 [Geoglossum simile]